MSSSVGAMPVAQAQMYSLDLARHGHQAGSQAAVDVAGHELELGLECGPALVGERDVLAHALVAFGDVEQRGFILRKTRQYAGHLVAIAQFALHVGYYFGYALVARVLVVLDQQVQLGVFLDRYAYIVQRLYGGVARHKVVGARAERYDLERLYAQYHARDRHELGDHRGDLVCRAHRIFRDIGVYAAQLEVVGCVEHTAIRVAAAVEQILAGLLGGGHEHHRAVKVLRDQRFGSLGAEIAQVHYQSVYAVLLKLFQSARGVVLVFHGGLDLDYFAARLAERLNYGVTAALAQVNREAVAADGHYAKLYLRYVHHAIIPPFHGGECRAD